ncbi:hypothetical protein BDZ94DRAFT_1241988 [Collybia nuda]|uniref:Uncharacterized protein n=1 Tax=Collybia nuda TaxID=64659 RepID=A0A9P5XUA1_9AGAR|nr:hypothetical protein BDZ94DRAFT_1316062 [Collybia nuda]KAF9455821.1 hypothetical protein BDZ94DRAFT_1241988 [Collybia nuda]
MPYFVVASKAGLRDQFLEAFYSVWFDRFPISVETEDPYELNFAIAEQQDILIKILRNRYWGCEVISPLNNWKGLINVEADRVYRRTTYYQCREIGIHLGEHQYIDTIEKEEDKLPVSAEENMRVWSEAVAIDANIFDTT